MPPDELGEDSEEQTTPQHDSEAEDDEAEFITKNNRQTVLFG